MKDFPEFMKQPANRIGEESQYTEDIEGMYSTVRMEARWHIGLAIKIDIQKNMLMNMMSTWW